jgi:hypothetical protein
MPEDFALGPGGTIENSPAFQRQGGTATAISPGGTADLAVVNSPFPVRCSELLSQG